MATFFIIVLAVCAGVISVAIAGVAIVWSVKVIMEYVDDIKDSLEFRKDYSKGA